MNEAQDKDTHGELDEKRAHDEPNPFHESPLDEFGQLRQVQG